IEVDVAVDEDRDEVQTGEHDGRAAEEAVEVEDPGGRRLAAEQLGREQHSPHDAQGEQRPRYEPAGSGDVPPDRHQVAVASACAGSPSANPAAFGRLVVAPPPSSTRTVSTSASVNGSRTPTAHERLPGPDPATRTSPPTLTHTPPTPARMRRSTTRSAA